MNITVGDRCHSTAITTFFWGGVRGKVLAPWVCNRISPGKNNKTFTLKVIHKTFIILVGMMLYKLDLSQYGFLKGLNVRHFVDSARKGSGSC